MIEARKLVGAELNPVVKVSCGNQVKWTKPCKGTKNPIFDEVYLKEDICHVTFCNIDFYLIFEKSNSHRFFKRFYYRKI